MKNISLLLMALAGVLLFLAGAVPHYNSQLLKYMLMGAGSLLVAAFYLLTLVQVIRTRSIRNSRRIVWIILILCAPLVGNLIYVFFHDADLSRQVPETK